MTCQMIEPLTLNTTFSERQKRMLGEVVWDFKGEEGNSHKDGKPNVWQTNVCWAGRDREHNEEF